MPRKQYERNSQDFTFVRELLGRSNGPDWDRLICILLRSAENKRNRVIGLGAEIPYGLEQTPNAAFLVFLRTGILLIGAGGWSFG
jgi:hypothetical protein